MFKLKHLVLFSKEWNKLAILSIYNKYCGNLGIYASLFNKQSEQNKNILMKQGALKSFQVYQEK